jgi:hypothetical protein
VRYLNLMWFWTIGGNCSFRPPSYATNVTGTPAGAAEYKAETNTPKLAYLGCHTLSTRTWYARLDQFLTERVIIEWKKTSNAFADFTDPIGRHCDSETQS